MSTAECRQQSIIGSYYSKKSIVQIPKNVAIHRIVRINVVLWNWTEYIAIVVHLFEVSLALNEVALKIMHKFLIDVIL